jgi:hypothetical protein
VVQGRVLTVAPTIADRARKALAAQIATIEQHLKTGDDRAAQEAVALGAYYLGHLHAYTHPGYADHDLSDPVEDRFHVLMHRVLKR